MTNEGFKATGYIALAVLALFAFVGIVAAWDESADAKKNKLESLRNRGAL